MPHQHTNIHFQGWSHLWHHSLPCSFTVTLQQFKPWLLQIKKKSYLITFSSLKRLECCPRKKHDLRKNELSNKEFLFLIVLMWTKNCSVFSSTIVQNVQKYKYNCDLRVFFHQMVWTTQAVILIKCHPVITKRHFQQSELVMWPLNEEEGVSMSFCNVLLD